MIYVVIAFLWVALGMYVIFGGADFGAGIVELFTKKEFKEKTQKIMYNSIGPVWEANHMWLIISIVILFVGFPVIYATLSEFLHIPLVIMLLGIIARGTSFTFRNYDVIKDKWHNLYSYIFTLSSLITPLFLGIIAASTVSGSIDSEATNFLDAYIFSWLTWFNVAVGFFTISICGFLASIYSIYSANDILEKDYLRSLARKFSFAIFLTGGLVFVVSFWKDIPLTKWIFTNWMGYFAVSLATLSILVLNIFIQLKYDIFIRVIAGFIVLMILFAVSYSHFPNLLIFKNGTAISLFQTDYSPATINMLGWALLLGSIFILPFLFYLIYSFNKKTKYS